MVVSFHFIMQKQKDQIITSVDIVFETINDVDL